MLMSNANQYLRPEYLTPLPTTLDAKKSPLALLAQTCSQIGADTSSKPVLTSMDKSNSNKSSKSSSSSSSSSERSSELKDKSSPHANPGEAIKSSFKPYESCVTREKTSSPEEQPARAPSSQSTSGRSRTPGNSSKRCSSNQSASSVRASTPQGRKTATPNGNEQTTRESPVSRTSSSDISSSQVHQVSARSDSSPYLKPTYSPSLTITDPSIKDFPLGTFKHGSNVGSSIPTASVSSAYLSYPPQLPIDVMASSLVSQHHATLKNGLNNSFLSYARVKNSSGTESLVPVCRDPYCTGCQLNSHLLAASSAATTTTSTPNKLVNATTSIGLGGVTNPSSTCSAGCVQCDHKPVSNPYGSAAHVSAMAAYAHAQLAALAAASQLPYICNWIAGDTAYCGKRFSTSEELLQHLRSHTSVSGDPSINTAAALSFFNPSAAAGLPPNHPLFSRTYPTPPLSPLATARYHPYGKASPLLPHSLSSLGLTIPTAPPHPVAVAAASLPPYLSPYSLYGTAPRLGATSSLHH